jgi:transcription elongation factor Elf1
MGIDIKIVPHPARRECKVPDGRRLFTCPKCKEDWVEAHDRAHWQDVVCEKCGVVCSIKMVPHIKDMSGIAVEGKVIGYCVNKPNGMIHRIQPGIDDFIWDEARKVVDKTFGGKAKMLGDPIPFSEVEGDDESTELEEDEDESGE